MAATTPRILLLGGHGRVSMQLTPMLLAKKWNVTSLVRNADHESEIKALGKDKPGQIDIVVESLEDVKSPSDAQKVLDKVKPDWVIWSAGAGGKGDPSRTFTIDRDAAKHYITSSLSTPTIKKFLMISYIASRKGTPKWWTEEDVKSAHHVNTSVLPKYAEAKIEADEHFAALTYRRNQKDPAFQGINLRPGTLTDDKGTGKVVLGKTGARGKVSREDVAAVAVELLGRDDTRGWYDMLNGEEGIPEAVERLVQSGWDGIEGEDLERIYARE